MFSKEAINAAIDVVREELDYIRITDPNATVEIDNLEFAIVSLEGYRDRGEIMARLRELEQRYELARNNLTS